MGRKPVKKFKANHRHKALALLNRGLTVDEVVKELRARYHPTANLADVKKKYFPNRSVFALGGLEGASREEIIERMRQLFAQRGKSGERMRRLNQDPDFARARDERMRRLNQDPDFARARDERMRRLHQDPDFARARDERMRRLHQDPDFQRKLREGIARYWNDYWRRMAELSEELGIHGLGWDYGERVAVTKRTSETDLILKERTAVIGSALDSLAATQRNVVEVIFFSSKKRNLTVEEAAIILDKPEKTILTALKKALTKLAKNKKLGELK